MRWLTGVAVKPDFHMGSDHRLLRGKFSFTWRRERREVHKAISQENFSWILLALVVSFSEDTFMDNIDEKYDRLVEHFYDCTRKAQFQNHEEKPVFGNSRADTSAGSCTSRKQPRIHVRARKASQRSDKRRP
ncbi:hypothetical protein RB195_015377 [Necator americanus]|uniref:Uncharacterized protein n=1 Tax=Necator americanus TaxID=51031 RepID=A0ABR1E493_NECAM